MKEKIIVIGDIHGRVIWQHIVAEHPDSKVVFLGDYCDPYPMEMIPPEQVVENLEAILRFKVENLERVELLVGNHDLPFLETKAPRCSRHDPEMEERLRTVYQTHRSLFRMAHSYSSLLFTHAGVVQNWFDNIFHGDRREPVAAQLNDPAAYGLQPETLYVCGHRRGGTSSCGGILWADAMELSQPLANHIQIVGHNRVERISITPMDKQTGVVFCDALRHGEYLLIESEDFMHEFYVAQLHRQFSHLITYFIQ